MALFLFEEDTFMIPFVVDQVYGGLPPTAVNPTELPPPHVSPQEPLSHVRVSGLLPGVVFDTVNVRLPTVLAPVALTAIV